MRHFLLLITLLGSTAATLCLEACNEGTQDCNEGTQDCQQLCDAAQKDDCTSITGDCGEFCAAVTSVQDEAGCADEREGYEACLNDDGVCGGSCDSEDLALTSCLTLYCATRTSEPDCITLVDAFG